MDITISIVDIKTPLKLKDVLRIATLKNRFYITYLSGDLASLSLDIIKGFVIDKDK